MARRKKSVSQRVVGSLTPGLPRPAKKVVTSRLIAPLILLIMIGLGATGVVTVKWDGIRPRLSINRQAASRVAEELAGPEGMAGAGQLAEKAMQRLPIHGQDQSGGEGSTSPWATGIAGNQISPAFERSEDTLRIASFNIQVFGTSKSKKPQVMDVLAQVVRRFDIVAVQELRTKDSTVMEDFVNLINRDGGTYEYLVGPRLGRTVSKEQYVFVYDSRRVEVTPNTVVTLEDPQDLLHREPLIARFSVRPQGAAQPFTFILVNVHTDPDETGTELDALGDAFVAVQRNPWREDDVILLGDLNVNHTKLGNLGRLPDIACTVHGEPTNTLEKKSYDNLVFNHVATSEFTGTAAVLNLREEFGLTMDQALEVSDHMPVWAEFTLEEGGARPLLARRNPNPPPAPAVQGDSVPPVQTPQPNPQGFSRGPLGGVLDRVQTETRDLKSRLQGLR